MEKDILYKYRSIDNLKNFLDIILNNRLYAAYYKDLNDPQEGQYYYIKGELQKETRDKLYNNKGSYKICSLSKTSDNQLMWSHYANGHKGVAIGVKVTDKAPSVLIKDINYSGLATLKEQDYTSQSVIDILSRKLEIWDYEKEVRVFIQNKSFIDVEVYEIIIGSKMSDNDKEFIKKIIDKINPMIVITDEVIPI
ncbi:DUF2971 domain-containing protein [Myroides sp. DW712]|uniref:DUF2971 domain-containing protein n=1 Tax=Myroides sp. DW712 TaxID=3389800 RepID=UPI00397C364F